MHALLKKQALNWISWIGQGWKSVRNTREVTQMKPRLGPAGAAPSRPLGSHASQQLLSPHDFCSCTGAAWVPVLYGDFDCVIYMCIYSCFLCR